MKKLLFLFPLLFTVLLTAQTEFAPLGATWYYEEYPWIPWIKLRYVKVEVTGIDTIQGRACKRIESTAPSGNTHWGCSFYGPTLHIYEKNGKVYSYHSGDFYLMYDFNAGPGESWVIHNPPLSVQDSLVVVVDSVSFITVNGHTLKVQHVSNPGVEPGGLLEWDNRIIENIGNTGFLTPQWPTCDPWIFGLRCFNTDSLDLHFVDYPCDSVKSLINTREPVVQGGWLQPNPVQVGTSVTLKLPVEVDRIELLSPEGVLATFWEPKQGEVLSIPDLPPGLFIARMYQKTKLVGLDKLLIFR